MREKYTFFPEAWQDRKQPFEGFVGQGWWKLLENLCDQIQTLVEQNPTQYETFQVTQIKEKFGTLRFYTTWTNDEIDSLIEQAETLAEKTCEECGHEGKLRLDRSWLRTLCDDCNR